MCVAGVFVRRSPAMEPLAAAAAAAMASPSGDPRSLAASQLTSPSAGSTPTDTAAGPSAVTPVANLVPPPMQMHQPRSRQRVSPLPSAHAHAAELELQPMASIASALPALQLSAPEQPSPSMQPLSAFPSLPAHLYGQQAAADAAAAAAAAASATPSAAFSQSLQQQPQQQPLGSFVAPLVTYPAPPPPLLLPPHLRDLQAAPPFQPQWQQHASAPLDSQDPYSFAGMHGTAPQNLTGTGGRPYFNPAAAATGFASYPPHAQVGMVGFDNGVGLSGASNPFGSSSAASAAFAGAGGLGPAASRPPLDYNFSVVEENEGEDGYDDDDEDDDEEEDDETDDDDDEHDPALGGPRRNGHEEEEDEDEATLAAEEQRIQAAADRFAQEQLAMQGCGGYLRSKLARFTPSFETQQRIWTYVWKCYRFILFLGLIFLIFAHPLRRVLLPGTVAVEATFDALFFLCFLVFLLEALVLLKFHPLYRRELHLLAMDFLAIVSILPFVGFVWDPLVDSLPPPKDFSTQPMYAPQVEFAAQGQNQGAQGNYHSGSSAPGDSPTNEFHIYSLSSLALIMLCRTSFHVRIIRFIKVHVLLRGITAFRAFVAERKRRQEVEAKKRRWIAAAKAREATDRTNRRLTHEALQEANVAHARAGALRALVAEASRELGKDRNNHASTVSKQKSRSMQLQSQQKEQSSTPKVSSGPSHLFVMPTVDSPMAVAAGGGAHADHEQHQMAEEQAMIAALTSTLAATTAANSLTGSQTTPEMQNLTPAEGAGQRRTSIPDGLHYSIHLSNADNDAHAPEGSPHRDPPAEHKEMPAAHDSNAQVRDELPPLLLSALEQSLPPTLYPTVSPYLSPGFSTLSPSHTTDASPSPYLRVHIGDDADNSSASPATEMPVTWPAMHHESSGDLPTPYALSHLSSAHDPAAVDVRSPSHARSSSHHRSRSRPSGSHTPKTAAPARTPRKMTSSQKRGDRADSDDDNDELHRTGGAVDGVTIAAISPAGGDGVDDWASEHSRSSSSWSDAWAACHDEHTGESDVGEDELMDEVVEPFDPTDPYKSSAPHHSAAPTAMPAIIGSFTSHQLSDFTTTVLIAITLLIVFVFHFVNRSPLDHASMQGLDQVSDLWVDMEKQLWGLNAALDSSAGVYTPAVAALYATFVSCGLRMGFHMRTILEMGRRGVEIEHLSFQHSLLFRPHVMPRLNWRAMLPDQSGQRDSLLNLAFGTDLTKFNDVLSASPFFLCLRPGVTTFEQAKHLTLPLPGAPGMSGYFVLRQSPDLETQSRNERVWRWASTAQTVPPTGLGSFDPPPIGGVPTALAALDPVPAGICYTNISAHTSSHLLASLYYLLFFLLLSSIVLLLYDLKVQQILRPIERMMLFIERMIGDPLGAISMRDHEHDAEHDEESMDHRKMDPDDEDDEGEHAHRMKKPLGSGAAGMDDDAAFDDPERRRKLLDASRALEAEELAVQAKRLRAGTVPAQTAPTSPIGYDGDASSSAAPREAAVLMNSSVPLQSPLAPPRDGMALQANMEERKDKESPHTGLIVLHGSPNSSPKLEPLRLPSSIARRRAMGSGPKGLGSRKPSDSQSESVSRRKSNSANLRRSSGSKTVAPQDPAAGVTGGTAPSSKRNSSRKSLEPTRKTSPSIKPTQTAATAASTTVVTTKSLRPSAAATAAAAASAAAAACQSPLPSTRHRSRNNETSTVEKGMQKLALLLQVGFGVAGSSIISNNLLQHGGSAASINPRGARGTKMFGIFGFTDLRNIVDSYFESGDEVDSLAASSGDKDRRSTFLSPKRAASSASSGSSSQVFLEQILVFINGLQALVHGETHRYGGFVNSSIGSNTLMAWKFDVPAFEKVEQQFPLEAFAQLKQSQQAQFHMQQLQMEQQQHVASMLAPPPAPHARTPSAGNTAENSAVPSVAPSPALTFQPAPGASSSLQPPLRRVPSGQYAASSRKQSLSVVTQPLPTAPGTAPAPTVTAGATVAAATQQQSQQPPPFSPGMRPMLPRQRSMSIQFGAQPVVPASPLGAPQTPSKHLTQQRRASMSRLDGFSPAPAPGTVPSSPAPSAARSALASLGGSSMSAIPLSMSMRSASIGAAQRDQATAAGGGSAHPSRRGSVNLGAMSPELVPASPRNTAPHSFALSPPPHTRSISSLPTSPLRRSVTMGNTSLAASQQQQPNYTQSSLAHPRAVQLGLDRAPPRSPRNRALGPNASPKHKPLKLPMAAKGARFDFAVVPASDPPAGLVRSQSLVPLPVSSGPAETSQLQNASALPAQPLSGSLPPSTSNSQPGSTSISANNSSLNLAALAQSASFGEHPLLVPSPAISASTTPAPLSPRSQQRTLAVAAGALALPDDTLATKRQRRHPLSTTAMGHARHRSFTFEAVPGEQSQAAPPVAGRPLHLVPSLLTNTLRTSSAGAMNAPDAAPSESGSARGMSTLAPPQVPQRRSSLPSLSLPPPAPVNPPVASNRSVALLSLAAAPSSSDFTLRPPLPRQGSLGSANSASSQALPSASDSSSQSLAPSLAPSMGSTAANSPRSTSHTVDALEDHRVRMLARLRTNSIPNIATAATLGPGTRRARQHMHSQSTLPASVMRAPLLPDAEPTTPPLTLQLPKAAAGTSPHAVDGSTPPRHSRSTSHLSSGRESKLREEEGVAASAAPSVVFHTENGCEIVCVPAAADDPTGSPTSPADDIVFHSTPSGSPLAISPPRALKIDLGELEGIDAVARPSGGSTGARSGDMASGSGGGEDSSAAGALPLVSWSSVASTSSEAPPPLASRRSANPMVVKLNRLDLPSNTSSPLVRERVFVPATPITPPRYEPAVSHTEPSSPMMTNAEAHALQRAAAARRNQSRNKLPVFDHAAIQSAAEEKSTDTAASVVSSSADPPLEPIDLDALVLSSRRSPAPPPYRSSGRSLVSNGLHVNTEAIVGARRPSGSTHPPLHSVTSSPALRPYRQGGASPAVRGATSPAPPPPSQPQSSAPFSVSPVAADDDLQPDSANLDDLAEDPLSPHNDITRAFVRMTLHPLGQMQLRRTASGALLAFAKTLVKIATDISLSRWRQHKLLKPHLSGIGGMLVPSSSAPDAPLKLVNRGPHMGLHIGWAIEGAIGSRHKIDATYLSPNVNLAARLAAATKQYYLPLLFSQSFLKLLPAILRARCRFVDKVLLKGSAKPMEIWTFDLFIEPEQPQRANQATTTQAQAATQPATVAASAVASAAPSVAGTQRHTPSSSESAFPHLVVEINGVTPPQQSQTPMPLAPSAAHTRQNSAQLVGGVWVTRERNESNSGAAGNESKQDLPARTRTPISGPPVLSRPASLVHQQQPATSSSSSQPSSTLMPYPSPSPSPQPATMSLLPSTAAHGSSSSFLSLPDQASFEAHVGQSLESDMSKLNAHRRGSLTGHARSDAHAGGAHHLRKKSSQVQMAQAMQQQQQVEWALMASQQQQQQQQLAHQQQQLQLQPHLLQIQQQQQLQQWQQQQEMGSMYDSNGQATHPMGLLSPSPAPPAAAPFDLASLQQPQPTPSPPAPAFTFPPSMMAAAIPHAHMPSTATQQQNGAPDVRIPMQGAASLPLPQLAPSLGADPVLQKILFVLLSLQTHTPHPLFTLTHNHATECYLRGEWLTAKQLYEQVLVWLPRDGPARVLLDFMAARQFQPPADWAGYRKLEKK